jgi:hypothetical protein
VVLCPDVAPYSDSRFDCRDLLQRSVIHYGAERKASSAIISTPIQGVTTGTVASVSRGPSEDRSSGLVSIQAGAFIFAASVGGLWRGSLKFAIRVARVTSSAARTFGFHPKTGMNRLFRTYRAPLSQCAMM